MHAGKKVKNKPPDHTLKRGVVKDDLDTALYLLPHLLMNVLSHGIQKDRQDVSKEIRAVLDAAATKDNFANNEMKTEMLEMSCQKLFQIIDWFSKCVAETQKKTKTSATTNQNLNTNQGRRGRTTRATQLDEVCCQRKTIMT